MEILIIDMKPICHPPNYFQKGDLYNIEKEHIRGLTVYRQIYLVELRIALLVDRQLPLGDAYWKCAGIGASTIKNTDTDSRGARKSFGRLFGTRLKNRR